ncbi:restriction endonuclease subunit S [Enterococcus faecium]|uniref:restriction endonuclease subunit S n=1 Tax=Enterococcus faecium TaxID=1352 RepID=UPI003CE55027
MSNDTQPEIRFPGFTEDWEERKLGDIFVYKQGQQVPVENQFTKRGKNRHRFIRIVDLTTNNEAPRYIEYSGDNIISSTDLFMIRYGQPGVIGYGYEGVIANNLFKLIPKIETYNLFFKYILDSMYPKIQSLSSSTTMPAISFKSLDVLAVRYPDKKEQEKIGSFFAQLDNTIALHQRKLDLLKETKKGFLQKMFPKNGAKVPEIRFPGFTEDWEQRKLGGIGKTYTGLTGKSKEDFGHGDAKFVTYMNVFQNPKATLEQLENVEIDPRQNEVKKGDVFFTTSSETPEEVGMSSVWTHDINNIYLNSFTFAYRPTIKFDLDYLAFMLRSQSVRKKIIFLAQGISRYNISKTKMMDISVPIPVNFEEQQKIGAFFKQLDDTIALHQRKLDLLKETKKGFLQKMFV